MNISFVIITVILLSIVLLMYEPTTTISSPSSIKSLFLYNQHIYSNNNELFTSRVNLIESVVPS